MMKNFFTLQGLLQRFLVLAAGLPTGTKPGKSTTVFFQAYKRIRP